MVQSPLVEQRVSCPFCAEGIDIVVDLSAGGQTYIEDCQVCCQPMQISFDTDGEELYYLNVDRAQ